MKSKIFSIVIFVGALIAGSVHAEGHLKATLIPADSSHPTKLNLTLTNDGDQPISFDKYTTPIALFDEVHTSFNQFSVADASLPSGNKARYRGYFVSSLSFPVSNFITLDPGQSVVATYDIGPDYELTPGSTYKVQFDMMVGLGPRDRQDNPIPHQLHIPAKQAVSSNVVEVTVPDTYVDDVKAYSRKTTATIQATDADKLDEAVWYADARMANSAWVHYQDGLPPYGTPNGKSVDSPQYAEWFGTYNDGDDNDQLVTGTLHAIATRLSQNSLLGTALHKMTFVACPDSYPPETAAIAYTGSVAKDGVYEIAICTAFWKLPAQPTKGVVGDSQPAILIHEVSHFSDLPSDVPKGGWTHVATDWKNYAYSRSACRQLVSDDRQKAVSSASNFEYFIEDVQTLF